MLLVATYAFLLVIFFSIIGTINTHQPISEFTMKLILFIIPVVMVFTWYANDGLESIKIVLNRNKGKENHGNFTDKTNSNI